MMFSSGRAYSQSAGLLSFTVDPKMLVQGPYTTSEHGALDLTIRLACAGKRYEVGLFAEIFSEIEYYSFGFFSNYKILLESKPKKFRRWVLPVGAEVGFIKRNSKIDVLKFNFALNGSLRYYFVKNVGLELGMNYRYRSDLEVLYHDNGQMRVNMFSGIVFRWP